MKLCPHCEFIYEDDQKFCDMDGQELVHDPKLRAFTDDTAALPSLSQVLKSNHAAAPVTKIHIPLPAPLPSPAAKVAAGVPARRPSGRQPRALAIVALAGLALVALLFAVYYARTYQSQTRKANRSSSESAVQSDGQPHAPPAAQSAAQSAAPVVSESAATPNETVAPERTLEQAPSDQAANHAGPTGQATLQASSSLANGSDKSVSRVRQTSTLVAARASSETSRAPVIIRLNNGASIKADEAWEKKEGVWYRQAGMVTFLKRSRVKSIQRPASPTRSQAEPKTERSLAQNQPRVGKSDAANAKQDSKVTSFLKKTGRILKKPFSR
jgi:hypothetical protein